MPKCRTKRWADACLRGEEAVLKLNGMLPPDVGIAAIHTVGEKAHARFDAVERGYTYLIHNAKDPFLEGRSTRVYGDLDVAAMQEASAHLVRKDDFASFCKAGSDQGTTICDVREARWEVLGTHRWAFHITADRFLRNMVRATVGTLIEVGKGKRRPEDILEVLAAKDRIAAGKSVLGCGLYRDKGDLPWRGLHACGHTVSLTHVVRGFLFQGRKDF